MTQEKRITWQITWCTDAIVPQSTEPSDNKNNKNNNNKKNSNNLPVSVIVGAVIGGMIFIISVLEAAVVLTKGQSGSS